MGCGEKWIKFEYILKEFLIGFFERLEEGKRERYVKKDFRVFWFEYLEEWRCRYLKWGKGCR